jgi:RHS repeat-associated protein
MMARNGAVTRYDYDAASGLASRTSPTGIVAKYAYDAGGNLASVVKGDADARYEWDGENRLVGITNGPKSRKYAYSAEGLRVSNATNDRSKRSLWDGVNLLAELDSSGATIVHYTDTPGTWGCLTSERRGDVSSHYIYDLSSNTRALVDNSGSIVAEYAYDAFGASLATTESAVTPYRFGGLYGYYSDDDDMVYVRARHYSTTHGRWISRDPLGFRGGDWNLHRYVGNRAVSEVDASGTNSGSCCATVRDDCNNKANKVIAYEQSIAAIMCPNGIPLKLAGGVAGCATLCKGKPACVAICSVLYLLACAAMSACVSARASAYATYCPEEYDYCAQGSKGTHPPRPNSVCGYSNNPATGSHYPGPDY